MIENVKSFLQDEEGQSMVEYGVVLGSVAAVSYIAVVQLGDKTADLYAWMANHLPGGEEDEKGTQQLVRLHGEGLTAVSGNSESGASFGAAGHIASGVLEATLGGNSTLIEED